MSGARLHLALLVFAVTGCAVLRGERGPTPEQQLERGLAALAQHDFAGARTLLEPLYHEHWQDAVGQRAMLALLSAELDSRNETRRLWTAADLAARYLNIEDIPQWHVPLAETLYLVALELGANEERLAQAETARVQAATERAQADEALRAAESGAARRLPTMTREPVPVRIRRLTGERDEMQRRLTQTEQRLATRERELRDAQQELERIRRTLKP